MEYDSSRVDAERPVVRPLREILVIVRDVMCGLLLFLVGLYLAGILDHYTPFEYPDLYFVWFACGLIPFEIFAHWRGALRFTWPVTVRLVALLVVVPFVPRTVWVSHGPGRAFMFSLVFFGALFFLDRLLAAVVPGYGDSQVTTKEHDPGAAKPMMMNRRG